MKIGQKSIIWFFSNIASSIIAFLATLYFARELGAGALGIYSLVVTLSSWLTLPTTMGIGGAVVKRVSEGTDQDELITAGATLLLSLLGVVSITTFTARRQINQFVGYEATSFLLAIILVSTLVTFSKAGLRGRNLVHISGVLSPIENTARSVLQIALLYLGFQIGGMLAGYAVGGIIALGLGIYFLEWNIVRPSRHHFRELWTFAQFSWLSTVRSKVFNMMDILVLGFFVSSALIGIYSVSWTLASFLGIFSAAIRSTVFPEVSDISSSDGADAVSELAQRALGFTGLFLIPGLVGAVLLGDQLLSIYGQEFSKGQPILVMLIGAYLLHSYGKQCINLLNGIDRPDLAFRISLVYITVNGILNVALVYKFGWFGAAIATVISSFVGLVLAWSYLQTEISVAFPVRMVGEQITSSTGMAIVVVLLSGALQMIRINIPNFIIVLVLVGTGAAVYFLILFGLSEGFRATVMRNIPV